MTRAAGWSNPWFPQVCRGVSWSVFHHALISILTKKTPPNRATGSNASARKARAGTEARPVIHAGAANWSIRATDTMAATGRSGQKMILPRTKNHAGKHHGQTYKTGDASELKQGVRCKIGQRERIHEGSSQRDRQSDRPSHEYGSDHPGLAIIAVIRVSPLMVGCGRIRV